MKKIFAVLALSSVLFGSYGASAQQKVSTSTTPTIYAKGDLGNGTVDTTVSSWAFNKFPLYSRLDTAVTINAANDSVHEKLVGEYNGVTLEVHATTYTGTSCDSVTVNFWGTATQGNGIGSYKLLQTTTLGSGTNEQVITYMPNNGIGNRWTNYRMTVDVADLAGTCKTQWQAWMLVR